MADDNDELKDDGLTPSERMRRWLWGYYAAHPMAPSCAAHLERWFTLGEPPMPPPAPS
jgi:hypothetical protein